jgi:hypothetical protein
MVRVSLEPDPGHGLRHVNFKLVWWCVLAGVQAGATVVAQVGQVVNVRFAKFEAPRHGRKDGTETFTVTTGIAYLHLPRYLCLVGAQTWLAKLGAVRQVLGRLRQCFKRLHRMLLIS